RGEVRVDGPDLVALLLGQTQLLRRALKPHRDRLLGHGRGLWVIRIDLDIDDPTALEVVTHRVALLRRKDLANGFRLGPQHLPSVVRQRLVFSVEVLGRVNDPPPLLRGLGSRMRIRSAWLSRTRPVPLAPDASGLARL